MTVVTHVEWGFHMDAHDRESALDVDDRYQDWVYRHPLHSERVAVRRRAGDHQHGLLGSVRVLIWHLVYGGILGMLYDPKKSDATEGLGSRNGPGLRVADPARSRPGADRTA